MHANLRPQFGIGYRDDSLRLTVARTRQSFDRETENSPIVTAVADCVGHALSGS